MQRFCWGLAALLAAVGLSAAVQFGLVTGRHPSSPLLEVPGSSRVLCAIRCLRDTSCVSWEVTGSGCSLYRGVTSDPTAATSKRSAVGRPLDPGRLPNGAGHQQGLQSAP
ncbi:hypothetical protein FJT64_013994 [Amphibalanus amphitrite]|uniref:Apple domain-containing protein n=1 Tax=Amphibalanus amphitrite TaxID=1232801 RepID=A0A6A4UV64_AMPAM|nr:hypothetical protein FJT64_013994 [Amphibalanus amphitrite]